MAAAEGGAVAAQAELGRRYACGIGVPCDYVLAHKWLNLAAARGSAAARGLRADLAGEMAAAEIACAQKLAREWMRLRLH